MGLRAAGGEGVSLCDCNLAHVDAHGALGEEAARRALAEPTVRRAELEVAIAQELRHGQEIEARLALACRLNRLPVLELRGSPLLHAGLLGHLGLSLDSVGTL